MDDLISRQAMIDEINKYFNRLQTVAHYDLLVITKNLPSAEPKIIRCKDCKHRFVDGENVRFNVCELNHNKVQGDDWFCADAERRENG